MTLKLDLTSDFTEIPHREPLDKRPAKALVLVGTHSVELLQHQGSDLDYEMECVGLDVFTSSDLPAPGVWVWEGKVVNMGLSDWPGGGNEYGMEGDWRVPLPEELERYTAGEYIWDLPSDEMYEHQKQCHEEDMAEGRRKADVESHLHELLSAVRFNNKEVFDHALSRLLALTDKGEEPPGPQLRLIEFTDRMQEAANQILFGNPPSEVLAEEIRHQLVK